MHTPCQVPNCQTCELDGSFNPIPNKCFQCTLGYESDEQGQCVKNPEPRLYSCSELDPFCAECDEANPTKCRKCLLPGWEPGPVAGECRPVGCLSAQPYCRICDDDGNGACQECEAGFEVHELSGSCKKEEARPPAHHGGRGDAHATSYRHKRSCKSRNRHCDVCSVRRPALCHKCRKGYRKDRLTGKCRKSRVTRSRFTWRRVFRKVNGRTKKVWRPVAIFRRSRSSRH